ncbi:putative F-box protein At3g52320 isoform X2 [Brachypodium distachyon]|uniref:putative F-box protein At3g52320 isoform X2 n=1 Tax=Brachypodium distachyon TaxID=15368 RepID=UPI00052FEB7D|nr:putative F-box protein At3g52320 isoform X2 [Brachypodium distachyon]|eukprot:XP_010240434.1 putative F-box protein At3g52320 isoform X2 [Brachypodium distachyon]
MAVDGITDDILVEILSRVPAKSLCRFKCVSKHWLGLTNDRNYLKKLPQTLTGFFYSSTTEGQFLESPIVFTSLSGSHGCPPIDTSFAFLPSHQRLNLLDCCNGLLLFRCHGEMDRAARLRPGGQAEHTQHSMHGPVGLRPGRVAAFPCV